MPGGPVGDDRVTGRQSAGGIRSRGFTPPEFILASAIPPEAVRPN